jgi:hypothetical protein
MPNTGFKILGREPAFFVAVLEAVLALLLTFGVHGLTQDNVGVIVATATAAAGLLVAWATHTTLFSALVGFAKSALVLAVTFGVHLTDAQTGALMALIVLVAGAYLRDRTTPAETAVSAG